jgi:hypothetical protein
MIVAAATATAGILQQQQQANISNDYEKALYGERKEEAIATFAALRERDLQERERAAQSIQAVVKQARQAQAAAKLQALEGGAGGQSVNTLLAQFERMELANVGVVGRNLEFMQQQIQREAVAAGRIQGPNRTFGPLDTPLGIVVSGLNVAAAVAQSAPTTPAK